MTGLVVASVIVGLIMLVGWIALFMLMPILLAILGSIALAAAMGVVAILVIPGFVTLDDFKPQVIDALNKATGREIAIGGPIGFTVWPVLGLQLRDISVGNPEGAKLPIMLAAQQLGVGVTLKSLLDHKLELREIRVVGGQLNLAVDAQGRGNWVFKSAAPSPVVDEKAEEAAEHKADADFAVKDIQIEKLQISDTNISYDSAKGTPVDLDDIDLVVTMPGLDAPLSLKGDVSYRGQEIKLAGSVANPRAAMAMAETAMQVGVVVAGSSIDLDGTLNKMAFHGKMTVDVASLPKLMAWVSGTDKTNLPFTRLALSTGLKADGQQATLSGLSLKLDDLAVSGKASANWSLSRPALTADVDVGAIDLDRFMGGDPEPATAAAASGNGAASAAPDLSGLNAVNADIVARLAGLSVKGAQLGATTAKISLQNGRLQTSTSPASFFKGTLATKADVSAGSRSFATNLVLSGIEIEPVLKTFADNDRLSGKGDLVLDLTGPVSTPEGIKRGLDGTGRFAFRDGALKGVNIAALIRSAKSVLGGQAGAAGDSAPQTDFTELSGSFTIANGLVSNSDLKMLSPLVRVTGKGTASLPESTANYRIEAGLVADLAGQGGSMERKGLIIPVNVRGPFSALRYEPDLQGLVLGNIEAAKDIGSTVQQLGTKEGQRNARDAVKGLLGLPSGTSAQPSQGDTAPQPPQESQPSQPQDVLKGLLNR